MGFTLGSIADSVSPVAAAAQQPPATPTITNPESGPFPTPSAMGGTGKYGSMVDNFVADSGMGGNPSATSPTTMPFTPPPTATPVISPGVFGKGGGTSTSTGTQNPLLQKPGFQAMPGQSAYPTLPGYPVAEGAQQAAAQSAATMPTPMTGGPDPIPRPVATRPMPARPMNRGVMGRNQRLFRGKNY